MTPVARPTKPQPPNESDHPRRPLRLLVVDDHPAVRAGLRQLLVDQADFEVAAAVATADEALASATDCNIRANLRSLRTLRTRALHQTESLAFMLTSQ